jgi:hypothetical protein
VKQFYCFLIKGEKTTKTSNNNKCPKFKCNTFSDSPSASGVIVSPKQEEKKGILETAL